jgi:multidrug efflux pump subunit AcrB
MRIWKFAVERWQFTLVVFALLVALGAYAFNAIPRQEDPSFPIPVTSVIVVFPGADPADVERLAVRPIEDAIAELDDVNDIRSTAEDGLGVIRVEFDWSSDPEKKYDEVVREVNALRGSLPAEIREVILRKTNPALVNIVQYALVGDTVDPRELRRVAEDLEEAIETVPGIRRADRWAFPEPEVRVALDLPRMAALGIDLATAIAAVEGEGASVPGGAVEVGPRRYNIKTTGDYESLDEVADTVVVSRPAGVVRLRDIADVRWATEEALYLGRYNGRRAAFVTANMKEGENIFDVQAALDRRIERFQRDLPEDMELVLGFEQARNVSERLQRLGIDFLIAIGLVSLTLLPLGLRAAGIVMVAIPLSLAMGLAGLWFLGFSLNQISIAGFVVALGLLVDDAIVVVENIARHLREGYERTQAAIVATDQISLAVLGCTATLVFAFLPLLNLPEGAGKFTRGLPLAVVLTILASLLVAFTIVPFLASRFLPRHADPEGNAALRWVKRGIHAFYQPLMHRALARPWAALAICFALFGASLLLVPKIGFSLFPPADKPQFLITIKAPEGSALDATDRALRLVEAELARHPEVNHAMANLGKGNPLVYYNVFPLEQRSSTAEVFVELEAWREEESLALLDRLRAAFADYADAQIVVKRFENGPPIEAPIAVRIIGRDLDVLERLAAEVESIVESTPGTRDVTNPVRLPRIDLDLGVDLDRAGLLGIASNDIDRASRLAVAGYPAATFRESDGDSFPVVLRLPVDGRPTIDLLDDLRFTSRTTGASVPMSQVAQPRFTSGPNRIERYDRERLVTVTSYVREGFVTSKVTRDIAAKLESLQLPRGYRIAFGGEAQAAARSLAGLGTAVLIAVFGILAVLVLEFGSFRSVLIVAGVIPFGVLGGLVALFLSGYTLSYVAIIGFVALIGVEIKNSILLVDFTNQLRRQGVALGEAIERAGETRFLPVLLTSVTAIGGLTPLALADSALYSPLAVVMIGGLISSTLLARVVTPVMYALLPPVIEPVVADGARGEAPEARGLPAG